MEQIIAQAKAEPCAAGFAEPAGVASPSGGAPEGCPACCGNGIGAGRRKVRSPGEYKKLMNRLNRIEGQIRGIRNMVEKSAYCPDILLQCSAAGAALNAFTRELLASHVKSCVAEDIRSGREGAVEELAEVLRRIMR